MNFSIWRTPLLRKSPHSILPLHACTAHAILTVPPKTSYSSSSVGVQSKQASKMELEAPIVHLPMKRLKFLYTTTTLAIEKDIQAVIAKVQYLKANASNLKAAEASEMLLLLINRLESLQRKVRQTFALVAIVPNSNLESLTPSHPHCSYTQQARRNQPSASPADRPFAIENQHNHFLPQLGITVRMNEKTKDGRHGIISV